ncbi:hypothetical protein C0991_003398 [Blastosporella zonata]|nr:hypothetical protein C0991_003398 [Blastosporella zonata]
MDTYIPVPELQELECPFPVPNLELPAPPKSFRDRLQDTVTHLLASKLMIFKPKNPDAAFGKVPFDIFLDNITPLLQVEDILALRRVNKHLFHLTHEPLIWRRFVQEINVLIPAIRPTFKFGQKSTSYEFEELVSRSISLENKWRQKNPAVVSVSTFNTFFKVLEMALLPGGKYLVASVREGPRFYIMLYHLDHPTGPHVLARLPIPTKAYKLKARYMMHGPGDKAKLTEEEAQIKPVPVIMIAYAMRTYREDGQMNHDLSEFSNNHIIDPPAPLKHDVVCVRVDLCSLDQLAGAHRDPDGENTVKHKLWSSQKGPFIQTLVLSNLHSPVEMISLFERSGTPWVSVHQMHHGTCADDYIRFGNLWTKQSPTLFCPVNAEVRPIQPQVRCGSWHTRLIDTYYLRSQEALIRAVLPLPGQNQMLVFRTVKANLRFRIEPVTLNFLELFDMPDENASGVTSFLPVAHHWVTDKNLTAVHISDYVTPTTNGDTNYTIKSMSQPLAPISIYLETHSPPGIDHSILWPSKQSGVPHGGTHLSKLYKYDLSDFVMQTSHQSTPLTSHVLPGAFRSIVYTTSENDRTDAPSLHALRRYINPEFQTEEYPIERVKRESTAQRKKLTSGGYACAGYLGAR